MERSLPRPGKAIQGFYYYEEMDQKRQYSGMQPKLAGISDKQIVDESLDNLTRMNLLNS